MTEYKWETSVWSHSSKHCNLGYSLYLEVYYAEGGYKVKVFGNTLKKIFSDMKSAQDAAERNAKIILFKVGEHLKEVTK